MCSECLLNENTEYTAFGFFLKNLLLEINSNKYVGINDMIINKGRSKKYANHDEIVQISLIKLFKRL